MSDHAPPSPDGGSNGLTSVVRRVFGGDSSAIKVKGHDDLLVYRARCCNPIRGEEIEGYVTRGKGVAVHSKSCANVVNLMFEPERHCVPWSGTAEAADCAQLSGSGAIQSSWPSIATTVLACWEADCCVIGGADVRTSATSKVRLPKIRPRSKNRCRRHRRPEASGPHHYRRTQFLNGATCGDCRAGIVISVSGLVSAGCAAKQLKARSRFTRPSRGVVTASFKVRVPPMHRVERTISHIR